jgi:hypothetical protein
LVGSITSAGIDDDGHYRSINIKSFWYKDDPFIVTTQARKIFYLQDTSLGKDWRVVQKFEHKDMYDVNEIEPAVHQDDHCSDNKHEVLLGDGDQVMHEASHAREGTVIQANLEDLLRDKREAFGILEGSEDEDEDEDDIGN